jgi:hypothetical protein
MSAALSSKAIIHVYGTLLRRAWWAKDYTACIVVRPSGKERDEIGYVVNQIRFDGPSEMKYSTEPRSSGRHGDDKCKPDDIQLEAVPQGVVGKLPGFDGAVLVYLEAEESDIHVQPRPGDKYIPFKDFRHMVANKGLQVPTLDPMSEKAC